MGRQIDFDGVVYCDWRINVRNCVDEEFFFHVLAYSTIVYFLAFIVELTVILFRVRFLSFFLSYNFVIN